MSSVHQPFLYEASRTNSFPEKPFDPKAVTRASWEPKPVKPKRKGPLLDVNRHPDAHGIIGGQRQPVRTMGRRTKSWIVAMRIVLLCLRVPQLLAAMGLLALMILFTRVADLPAWVLRITAGVVVLHCIYGIYHLSRRPGARTPASSSAYQLFSAMSDLCVLPLYGYGMLAVRNDSDAWSTLLPAAANTADLLDTLKTAYFYTLLGAASLHLVTLAVALWLALKFRQITLMPPDMNPLEDHLTSRGSVRKAKHARNKSSVVTMGSLQSVDFPEKPPAVPFAHTRSGSTATTAVNSVHSRDSRLDLPSRQYQIMPSNVSNRNSLPSSLPDRQSDRQSDRGTYAQVPLHEFSSYAQYTSAYGSRPGSKSSSQPSPEKAPANRTQQRNQALNTLMFNASGMRRNYNPVNQKSFDLVDSDGENNDDNDMDKYHRPAALGNDDENRPYNYYYEEDQYHESQNNQNNQNNQKTDDDDNHPNPLRSHPAPTPKRSATRFHPTTTVTMLGREPSVSPTESSMTSSVSSHSNGHNNGATPVLGELNVNDRRVSGGGVSGDLSDGVYVYGKKEATGAGRTLTGATGTLAGAYPQNSPNQNNQNNQNSQNTTPTRQKSKRWTWGSRRSSNGAAILDKAIHDKTTSAMKRQSSIQTDEAFSSKPYGSLRPATPPILVGQKGLAATATDRQVSSGNDYDLGNGYLYYSSNNNNGSGVEPLSTFGRRHVSGKLAEEGRAYGRFS